MEESLTKRSLPAVGALVFLTGAAAMVYELVWARWLMLAFGAGAGSVALALAAVMLGLGLGSEAGGRWADAHPNPLRLYGALEVAVGVSALVAGRLLASSAQAGFLPDLPRWASMAAALGLLSVPSAFMGATLPALAAHLGRTKGSLEEGLARIYAANVIGAVAGVLAAGFFLIEKFGLQGSAAAAASANFLAGAAALLLARLHPGRAGRSESSLLSAPAPVPRAALAAAGVSGFAAMAYEVLDTRLLIHGLLNTTHALTLILASFLGGMAAGALLCAGRLKARRSRTSDLGWALLAASLLALAFAPSLAQTSTFAAWLRSADPRWGVRIAFEAALAGALLLPGTMVMGFIFPAAAALGASSGRAGAGFGRVSLVNTVCGVLGALGAGFALLPAAGLRVGLAAVALVQAGAGALLLFRSLEAPERLRRAGWGIFGGLAVFALFWARPASLGGPPGRGTLAPAHVVGREAEYQVLCYHEGAIATTQVLRHIPSGRRELDIDGFIAAGEAPAAGYMALMGRLPMRLHPHPRRALVICFGTGATARAAAENREAELDLVDLDADVFACAPSFGEENSRLLSRARAVVKDGRRFLREEGPAYDVITQEPMPPYFAGTSALYSVEYYKLARRRLSSDGLLVQWLPLHLVAPGDARQIVAAALAVFPETWVALAPGDGTGLVVAAMRPLEAGRLEALERELGIRFVLKPGAAARYASGWPPVTDDRPMLEYRGVDRVRALYGGSSGLHQLNLKELIAAAQKDEPGNGSHTAPRD